MIVVQKCNRVGFTSGCWRISKRLARRLCGGRLPLCGWKKCIKTERGQVRSGSKDYYFPAEFTAWVSNHSNAEFILTDENHILEIKEV